MKYKPSKYQSDIYREFQDNNTNILISAVAGSGKTSTLLELLKLTHVQTTFVAFNKSIQQEIEAKVGQQSNVDVMTIHSLGMKALMRHFRRKLEVKSNKIWDFTNKLNKQWDIPKNKYVQTVLTIQNLVDIYRLTMCETDDRLREVADGLGIDYTNDDIRYSMEVLAEYKVYNQNPEVIDFTDMIYIPATNKQIGLTVRPKLVFIDECQDLNACQHALIDRMIKKNHSRFVACGDPYQSIYGFAGADSNSFNQFLDKPNVKQMPLSICYRCPTRVVDKANQVHNIMEPFEGNEPGEVRLGKQTEIQEGDMVLCRNVKPLVKVYFNLLAQGKKASIRGKDLGKGLIKLVKPFEYQSVGHLMVSLSSKLNQKRQELIEREIESPSNHPSYVNLQEKIEVITFVGEQFERASQIIDFFEKLFQDNQKKGVMLSTVHKSKGLESSNVFLLDRQLIPSKFAKTPDQIKQELNLMYVAITRSQSKLIFIHSQQKNK